MPYQFIIADKHGKVGLITLNRPQQLNALCDALIDELGAALAAFEADETVGSMVITGSPKAFAAGADITAMKDWSYMDVYQPDYLGPNWARIRNCRKPVIAAVAGYALGGGCELAMSCDMIFAGAGGTQRLPRAIGKAKAMDMCLTARMMDAKEAEQAGLVARVIAADQLIEETLAAAETIAGYSLPVIMMIKEAINRAYEMPLGEGLLYERRVFQAAFALADRKEGMAAFVEKRQPAFKNR